MSRNERLSWPPPPVVWPPPALGFLNSGKKASYLGSATWGPLLGSARKGEAIRRKDTPSMVNAARAATVPFTGF
jgi:hypothetical protein